MKYRSREEMKKNIEQLGSYALSKFSSISHLSKLQIPLDGMIEIEILIREIECNLWSLVPLGLGNDNVTFELQITNIQKSIKDLIEAARLMKQVKDSFK